MSDCLTPSRLERLADQSGGDVEGEKHLADCDACRAAVEELRSNREFVAGIVGPLRSAIERPIPAIARTEQSFFPGYRRLDVLGHGGQAVVHRAIHEASGRVVAVKVLRFGSIRQRARLAREAQLAATLRHPGIVTIHDCGDLPEGGFAIVMELVDGLPLDVWSNAVRGALDTPALERRQRIARLFIHVCDAVAHAHHNGVIHRDLKPANVLVGAHDQPRVLDFGVAHMAHPGSAPAITRTDEFSGTLAYAAPETLSNSTAPAGTLADVYALGVMLHEAIVGRSPHRVDGSVDTIVRSVVDSEPVRPTSDVDGAVIDDDLSVIIVKALARDPNRRYDSPAALGRDLDNWIAGRPIDARRDSLAYLARVFVRRNRLAVAGTVAVMVLLAGSVVALAILYSHAESARAGLANQLFERNLEQASMLASAERPGPAEALAWREALAPSSPRAIGAAPTDPDFLALLWTLRQVVARNPCLAATIIGPANATSIASLGDDGFLVGWDDGSINCVRSSDLRVEWKRQLEGAREAIVAVDATNAIVAASVDRTRVVLMDSRGALQSPRRALAERPLDDRISLMTFDAGRLWIVSVQGNVLAFDTESGQIVREFKIPPWPKNGGDLRVGLLITPDLGAIDLADGTELDRFVADPRKVDPVRPAAICADGRVLVPDRGSTALWNPRTKEIDSLPEIPGYVRRLLVAGDDATQTTAVVMFDDGGLRLVDLARPASTTALSGHPSRLPFRCLAAWVGREKLATAGSGGLLRVWDTHPGRWISTYRAHSESIGRLSFGLDRQTLFTFGREGAIGTWSRGGAQGEARPLPSDASSIRAAFSPDGSLVALDDRSDKQRAIVRRTSDLTIVAEHPATETAGPFDFSPDGRTLVGALGQATTRGGFLGILDVESGAWRMIDAWSRRSAYTRVVRHSPDGRFLAWGLIDGRLYVLDVGATELPAPFQLRGPARAVVFSPDGDRLLVSHDDGHVTVLDRRSGAALVDIAAHAKVVADVAWSPDGRTLATADSGGEVILWCATTYRRLATMNISPTGIQTIIFSPDGDRLLVGDDPGRVTEWDFSFYDQAIARSVDAWIELLRRDGVETPNAATMRAWASGVVR